MSLSTKDYQKLEKLVAQRLKTNELSAEEFSELQQLKSDLKATRRDLDKVHAKIGWKTVDVKELRPQWSLRKCEQWLIANAKYLQDGTISTGWSIMESLL
jgi:hypothetical protein